jgi:hypothetical protein
VGAPKNTPSEIVVKFNKAINKGLTDPKMKMRFADFGGMALGARPPTSVSSSQEPMSD